MEKDFFQVAEYEFEVDVPGSTLEEYNDDFTRWNLMIQARPGKFADYACQPNLRCEAMLAPWGCVEDLQGRTVKLKQSFDKWQEEYLFTFYMAQHSGVRKNRLTFGKIANGRIPLHWTGLIEEMHWGKYDRDVPFELQVDLPIVAMVGPEKYQTPDSQILHLLGELVGGKQNAQEDIWDEMLEMLEAYVVEKTTVEEIYRTLADKAFLKVVKKEREALAYFVEEFLDLETVPNKMKRAARKAWKKRKVLRKILQEI